MEEYINSNGDLYTMDEINQAAEENNTTFEDILKKNKLSLKGKKSSVETLGKKKTAVAKDATVAVKNTASKSVQHSSDSSNNGFGEVKIFDPLGITKASIANAQIAKNPPKPVSVKNPKSTIFKESVLSSSLYSGSDTIHSVQATLAFVRYKYPAAIGLPFFSTISPPKPFKGIRSLLISGQSHAFHQFCNTSQSDSFNDLNCNSI